MTIAHDIFAITIWALQSDRDHQTLKPPQTFWGSFYHTILESATTLKRWGQPKPPTGWVQKRLMSGQCLVMMDGLDEIADPQVRKKVVAWVERQMIAYKRSRF